MFSFNSISRVIDGEAQEVKDFIKDTSCRKYKQRYIRYIFQRDHPFRLKPNFHPFSEGVTWDDYEDIVIYNNTPDHIQIKAESDHNPQRHENTTVKCTTPKKEYNPQLNNSPTIKEEYTEEKPRRTSTRAPTLTHTALCVSNPHRTTTRGAIEHFNASA